MKAPIPGQMRVPQQLALGAMIDSAEPRSDGTRNRAPLTEPCVPVAEPRYGEGGLRCDAHLKIMYCRHVCVAYGDCHVDGCES